MDLRIDGIAKGGAGVARTDDGLVVFVGGALPGELVRVGDLDQRSSFANAELVAVVEPSPQRRDVPCPSVARGCGGCDLQHATPDAQGELKLRIVRDALERIAGLAAIPDLRFRALPAEGYRTTVRMATTGAGLGYRARSSNDVVAADTCLVLHPGLAELVEEGSFKGTREVTLRIGAATGERLVLVEGQRTMLRVPDDVRVIARHELKQGRRAWIHEDVAGRRWRISADSFFQARQDGAQALVDEVRRGVGDRAGLLADLYGGVGLFGGALGDAGPVVVVESSRSSTADARHNLADLDATVVRSAVERWKPSPCEVVVADPSRKGLGRDGVATVSATGASLVVLVSCDPAAMARDVKLLSAAGFVLDDLAVIDMFGNTSHIEVVSTLRR